MKKIIILMTFLIIGLFAKAQYLISQTIGADSTLATSKGGLKGRIINFGYVDTSSANIDRIRQYPGSQIFTTFDNSLWYRNATATAWIKTNSITVTSYGKNTTKDSTILVLSDGTRYAARDSFGIFGITCEGLKNGGVVTWDSLLVFAVSAAKYCINDTGYSSLQGVITLNPADSFLPRIDVIALDRTGTIIKITGVPAANPAAPQVDPAKQLQLTTVLILAGATTPAGISNVIIYNENIEWTGSATGFGANFNNLVNPLIGVKAIDVGSGSNGSYLSFVNTSVLNTVSYNSLKMYIRMKASISNASNLSVSFYNGATPVSNSVTIGVAQGFSKTIINTYQNVSLNLNSFTFTSSSFDRIRITFTGSSFSGAYFDYIILNSGVSNGSGSGTGNTTNGITNVYRITGTDSVMKVINGTTSFAFSRSSNTIYQIQTAAGGIQTFTFTTVPASYADYVISVNGVIMRAGIDFTRSSNNITIPTITDGEYVEYRKIN